MEAYSHIDALIKEAINKKKKIVIYPMGPLGIEARNILYFRYDMEGVYVDNYLCQTNKHVISLQQYIDSVDGDDCFVILTAKAKELSQLLLQNLKDYNVRAEIKNVLDPVILQKDEKEDWFKSIKKYCKVKKTIGVDLIRMGRYGDGGYVMVNDLHKNKIAYSFGIGDETTWEENIAEYGIDVFCYDYSINYMRKTSDKINFYKLGVAGHDMPEQDLFSLETLIRQNHHENEQYMILKMDIEGAEWDSLSTVSEKVLKQFSQISFELHNFTDLSKSKGIAEIFEKLNRTHQAVWVHGNNACEVESANGNIEVPRLLEITYVNRDEYQFEECIYNGPISIDAPNMSMFHDIKMKNW